MHALTLLCIKQQTKFDVPSFAISKYYDWRKKLNRSLDPDYARFRGGLSSSIYLYKKLTTLALAISEISLGARKFKMGYVTLTTPLG